VIQHQAAEHAIEPSTWQRERLGQVMSDELNSLSARLGPRAVEHGGREIYSGNTRSSRGPLERMPACAAADIRQHQTRDVTGQAGDMSLLKQHQRIVILIIKRSPAVVTDARWHDFHLGRCGFPVVWLQSVRHVSRSLLPKAPRKVEQNVRSYLPEDLPAQSRHNPALDIPLAIVRCLSHNEE